MILTNEELKNIYFGAYEFEETGDGYLQAFQYSKEQVEYFKGAFEMWYERCDASTAKTLELRTDASKISFDYKFQWKCSEDSVELYVDELTRRRYVGGVSDKHHLVNSARQSYVFFNRKN